MFTLRASAGLLRTAASVDDLQAIATAIGFSGECVRLDTVARAAFGIDDSLADARLATGPGSLRALLFEAPADSGRGALTRVAGRLSSRAPHVLWVLIAVERDTNRVAIAAATPGERGVKVAALMVERSRVLDSDAETLRLLVAARAGDDLTTHARFLEVLGRDALTRRFFRKLEECVASLASSTTAGKPETRREIALLYASRLLFLGFLESKGWLDDDAAFLTNAFDDCMSNQGGFHRHVLLPLFFGTLNTPRRRRAARARRFGRIPFLNGGLFTPTAAERGLRALRFSDEACGQFLGELLARYRFTSLEETATFEEAAVDPEMLGRAFESLMAADARRASGAFYTPHELVDRVTGCGLDAFFEGHAPTLPALDRIRVLDPACGSGAFLVHALDRIAALRRDVGDSRPVEVVRREVLSRSIFGVDVNPTAVWLCQLRLWLSIVVESRDSVDDVPPLPNLDRNVRIGDALQGPAFNEVAISGGAALRHLRERYARATGIRKASLAKRLDREERHLVLAAATAELARVNAARSDLISVRRGRDLFGDRYHASRDDTLQAAALRASSIELRRRIRAMRGGGPLPFSFPAHFADVASEEGFSLIVGNPPWVRPHHVEGRTRDTLRQAYFVARAAPWLAGAAAAGAGKGFSSQVDLAAIFAERSLRLLAPNGVLSLLLPSKLWRSLSAGGLRQFLVTDARVLRLEDYSDVPATFDAAVYPGLLVAARDRSTESDVAVTVLHRSRTPATWRAPRASITWDSSAGSPWLLIPPEVRRAFELVRQQGTPMSESRFGRPLLGVKCGLNEAFVVSLRAEDQDRSTIVAANGRQASIETSALRPVLKGESVRPWELAGERESIIWTHGADGNPMPRLPEGVARWLAPHRRALVARSDARQASRWWSVFRTEAAASNKPRVVWADIGRGVRATVLAAGDPTVPLNSCYIVRCPTMPDALALCALLNSPLASAWLSVIAEPARGGYRRYLGWTMSLLPIPVAWDSCLDALAAIGAEALNRSRHDCESDLLDAVISAYGLRRKDVDPLLAWTAD